MVLSIFDIPGPAFREAIRRTLTERRAELIIDARPSPPPNLDRLSMTVRLTRRAHRHGGEVIVIVDKTIRQRLTHARMDRWLN